MRKLLKILAEGIHEKDLSKIFVIAEMANAHQGDPIIAEEIISLVTKTRADAIKFQIYFANELFSQSHSEYNKYKNREWSRGVWKNLVSSARDSGLEVGADIFGNTSLDLALSLELDFLKIHSSDLSNYRLIKKAALQPLPLLLSVGGTTSLELAQAIETVRKLATGTVGLMYGFQGFPTDLEDSHISRIKVLQRTFGLHVGLADHVDADLDMAIHLPLIALGFGCRIFEKHITLDRSAKGIDYFSSLEPKEFEQMVNQLRDGVVALGVRKDEMREAENHYRSRMKKYVTTGESLKPGTILSEEKLALHRVENQNLPLVPLNSWVGKKLAKPVHQDHVMTYDDIVQQVGLCIIARFQSERLPGKALVDIVGKPSLAHLFERTQLVKDIAKPVLCTSTNPEDDKLAELAFSYGINVIRGDSKNVLSRLVSAIDEFGFDIVLRVTGDDILFDPYHAELLINYLRRHNLDYVSAKDLPGGTEAEAFTSSTLKTIEQYAEDPDYTEYLTYYVEDPSFACGNLPIKEKYQRDYSLSLDTPEDLQLLRKVFQAIYSEEKPYTLDQVLEYLDRNPSQLRSRRHNSRDSSKIKMKTKLNFGLA
jgi:N,N'-diacetyllegionaminate synthase